MATLIEDPRHELNDPSWEIARVVFWWLRQTSRVLFLDLSFGGEIQCVQGTALFLHFEPGRSISCNCTLSVYICTKVTFATQNQKKHVGVQAGLVCALTVVRPTWLSCPNTATAMTEVSYSFFMEFSWNMLVV